MRARHTFPIAALVALTGCATTSDPSKEVAQATSSSSSTQSAGGGGTGGAAAASAPLVVQSSSPAAANPPGSGSGRGGGAGNGSGSGSAPAQTPDEHRAELEHRFDDSLGSFDATLKKEQEELAKEHDAAVAAGGGGNPDGAAGSAAQGSAGTEGPRSGRGRHGSRPADHSGDLHSAKQDGVNAGGYSGNGASAREIPDGSDDDIVARRLRKAAEQETDPELKEKLWQEYVQYKKNAQAK